jgi:hypothetical protein
VFTVVVVVVVVKVRSREDWNRRQDKRHREDKGLD